MSSTELNQFGNISTGDARVINESEQSKKASSIKAVAIAIPIISLLLGALSVVIVWKLNLIPYGSLMFKIFYMMMIVVMWPFYWLVVGIKWILFGYKPAMRTTLII